MRLTRSKRFWKGTGSKFGQGGAGDVGPFLGRRNAKCTLNRFRAAARERARELEIALRIEPTPLDFRHSRQLPIWGKTPILKAGCLNRHLAPQGRRNMRVLLLT